MNLKDRIENLKRTWLGYPPKGTLEAWRNYTSTHKDTTLIEMGERTELVGRKYQQLQGLRKKDEFKVTIRKTTDLP